MLGLRLSKVRTQNVLVNSSLVVFSHAINQLIRCPDKQVLLQLFNRLNAGQGKYTAVFDFTWASEDIVKTTILFIGNGKNLPGFCFIFCTIGDT